MSPSGISRIFSGFLGVTPSSEISRTRIPDETPSKSSSVSVENTDAAIVSLRTQSAFEEDANVREQRVQRIKKEVRQGMYRVDSRKVAASVVKELAE